MFPESQERWNTKKLCLLCYIWSRVNFNDIIDFSNNRIKFSIHWQAFAVQQDSNNEVGQQKLVSVLKI